MRKHSLARHAAQLSILLIPAPRQLMTDCGLAIRFTDQDREQIIQTLEQKTLLPEFISKLENGVYVKIWDSTKNIS